MPFAVAGQVYVSYSEQGRPSAAAYLLAPAFVGQAPARALA
jgi:hypothetical protein